jgi:hypothetical protein
MSVQNQTIQVWLEAVGTHSLHLSDDYSHCEEYEFSIINSSSRVSVANHQELPRSRHVFTVDGADFGFVDRNSLRKIQTLLAVSLALMTKNIFFSSIHFEFLPVIPDPGLLPSEGLYNVTASRQVQIDEQSLLTIVSKLLQLGVGYAPQLGFGEAVDAYAIAQNCVTCESALVQLYSSLDKAINFSLPKTSQHKGGSLDQAVSAALQLNDPKKIEALRTSANRLKHPAEDQVQYQELLDAKNTLWTKLPELAHYAATLIELNL